MPELVVGLVAAIGGIAIALQSLFSGVIGKQVGVLGAVFIVHFTGLILAGALLALRGGGLAGWRGIPWYALSAGFIGVVIVACVSYAVPRLGLGSTLVITIASQLIVGAVLDHFGLLGAATRPLDPARMAGIGVLILGAWLVVR
ncbi:DMT family transporter [Candidatus Bipolaricaulota bacterium]|nr:DMT family transporter [Candidatus Bipolaricaulota bacterium]